MVRNLIIMKNLATKFEEYKDIDNYSETIYNYSGNNYNVTKCYSKGSKAKLEMNIYSTNWNKKQLIQTYDGNNTNTYLTTDDKKIAMPNSNGIPSKLTINSIFENYNEDGTNNLKYYLVFALTSRITSTNCDGKECYKVVPGCGLINSNFLLDYTINKLYIEKATGLMIRDEGGTVTNEYGAFDMLYDYQYEFNNVTDDNLVEPNISEYEIKQETTDNTNN